jgi:hypothetical protein
VVTPPAEGRKSLTELVVAAEAKLKSELAPSPPKK